MIDQDPPGVIVRLPNGEFEELQEHANALRIPVRTVLRRAALTAVRVTRVGITPQRLIGETAAALGRDFPSWRYRPRMRAAESVMRWLLARCAVVPLPAPITGNGMWAVQLHGGTLVEIRAGRDERGGEGVRVRFDGVGVWSFSPPEFRAVAAAGLAACERSTQDRQGVAAGGDS